MCSQWVTPLMATRLTPLLAAVLGVSSLLGVLTGFHATILAGPSSTVAQDMRLSPSQTQVLPPSSHLELTISWCAAGNSLPRRRCCFCCPRCRRFRQLFWPQGYSRSLRHTFRECNFCAHRRFLRECGPDLWSRTIPAAAGWTAAGRSSHRSRHRWLLCL